MATTNPIVIPDFFRSEATPQGVRKLLELVPPAQHDEFKACIDDIWTHLRKHLNRPVLTTDSVNRRTVTVLGFTRYIINRRSGQVSMTCIPESGSGRFTKAKFVFAIDLPLVPSLGLFEVLLARWEARIYRLAKSSCAMHPLFAGVVSVIRKATLQSVFWNKLRYAVRDALALDPAVLDIARRSRVDAHAREVSDRHFNFVVSHLSRFRQIQADNPRLLWLLSLAHAEHVAINWSGKEALEALRDHILSQFKLPPVAWRYLANGKRRDFRLVIDWLGANASPKGRWYELREWLRLLVALERDKPVPLPVQRLFLNDEYQLAANKETVRFRGVQFPVPVMRQLIAEAERHLAAGSLRAFSEDELVDVLSWLHDHQGELDKNRIKAGWPYLVRKSADWKYEKSLIAQRDALCWESLIPEHRVGSLNVRPVTDVWQLHREALSMRNCTSSYLSDCLGGTVRLFAIENLSGRQIATVGLTRDLRTWKVLDVRGFANVRPPGAIEDLAIALAERYMLLWTTLFPLLDQTDGIPAGPMIRQHQVPEDTASDKQEPDDLPEEEADDEEDEEDCFSESEGTSQTACPICGDECYRCEHLIVGIDYFNGGMFAGVLYDALDDLLEVLWLNVAAFAREGRKYCGLGGALDEVVTNVRRSFERDVDVSEIKADIVTELHELLIGALKQLPGVDVEYWEFDGGMPGCSTCGRNYWADDPASVLESLRELLNLAYQ